MRYYRLFLITLLTIKIKYTTLKNQPKSYITSVTMVSIIGLAAPPELIFLLFVNINHIMCITFTIYFCLNYSLL